MVFLGKIDTAVVPGVAVAAALGLKADEGCL